MIAAATRRLVGDLFAYADLGVVQAKGFPDPVPAYRILGTGAAESRFKALHGALIPLVGREEEIGLLLRAWQQATGGDGQVVMLAGEPGIGKSRILAALLEEIRDQSHVCLRYFCTPHRQDSALYPVAAQLEYAAGFERNDPPDARLGKLENLLAQTLPLAEDLALLAELLSIPTADRYPPLTLTPQGKRKKTLRRC